MNTKTLKALKGSIAKWNRIVRSCKEEDGGRRNCPLCDLFSDGFCGGCPVYNKKIDEACGGTPYIDWGLHHQKVHRKSFLPIRRTPGCKECLTLAKAERDFLKSLLP